MILNLKEAAMSDGLILNPKVIAVDFEAAAIAAFRLHFPNAKISGCHFHFSTAIYKKLVELGLKTFYASNSKFKYWVRLFMSLPFLCIDDIDEAYEELKSDLPDLSSDIENEKFKQFLAYLEKTWVGTERTKALFDRSIWNFHDYISYRTTNICESYNKRINSKISKPNPNIFCLIDLVRREETLKSVEFEKANLEHVKPRKTKNQIKDLKITNLKLKYVHSELDMMDYLMEISKFVKDFD